MQSFWEKREYNSKPGYIATIGGVSWKEKDWRKRLLTNS
nr:MAG TPA: hypothetical protein [Bacteriophage sp.]